MSEPHDETRGHPSPPLSVEMTAREVLEAIDHALVPIVVVLLKAYQDGDRGPEMLDVVLARLVPLIDEIEDALGLLDDDDEAGS